MLPFGEIQYNFALLTSLNISMTSPVLAERGAQEGSIMWRSNDSVLALVDFVNATQEAQLEAERISTQQRNIDSQLKHVDSTGRKPHTDHTQTTQTPPLTTHSEHFISGLRLSGDVSVSEGECEDSTTELANGWSLWLLVVRPMSSGNANFTSPWISSCTQPYVRYNPELTVCEDATMPGQESSP